MVAEVMDAVRHEPASTVTPVVEVTGLGISLQRRDEVVSLVEDVSLRVAPGETLGIVGESGSGKSLTLRALLGILPDAARASGQIAYPAGATRTAMVFQEPLLALNPTMRVGDFIGEVVGDRVAGRAARRARVRELMESVGIPEPDRRARMWPHELSGGLRQRVMIAAALATEPDLLLCDEPTTALDVTVQAQILALLSRLAQERAMAMIFVSHDLSVVAQVSDRIAVMYAGRIVEQGPADDILDAPSHPYTAALLAATPSAVEAGERLRPIPGAPPDPAGYVSGCRFQARCPFAEADCATTPHLLRPAVASLTACIHPESVTGGAA